MAIGLVQPTRSGRVIWWSAISLPLVGRVKNTVLQSALVGMIFLNDHSDTLTFRGDR